MMDDLLFQVRGPLGSNKTRHHVVLTEIGAAYAQNLGARNAFEVGVVILVHRYEWRSPPR